MQCIRWSLNVQLLFLGWTGTKQRIMCLAQGHNAVHPVWLEPANPQSHLKYSTTEPLCYSQPMLILLTTVVILGQIKISVFRVTSPYPNSLGKPRKFSGFLEKIFFMHFERHPPFKMHKMIFLFRKDRKKYVPLDLKFSDVLPETQLFFLFGLKFCNIFQPLFVS